MKNHKLLSCMIMEDLAADAENIINNCEIENVAEENKDIVSKLQQQLRELFDK